MRPTSAILSLSLAASSVSATYIAQRVTVDVCAYVDSDLLYLGFLNLGRVRACLCVKTLSDNYGILPGLLNLGSSVTNGLLNGLINNSPSKQTCNYPDHFQRACVQGNPCGFTCTDGFSLSADKKDCVCTGTGKKECNGVCGNFGNSCPSLVPRKNQRHAAVKRAASHCAPHLSVCAVTTTGGSMNRPWECVDGQNDLESCGGCIEPFNSDSVALGVDCTAIEGALEVACHAGKCDVGRCGAGYTPSLDRTTCEKVFKAPSKQSVMGSGHYLRNATRIL